MTIHEGRYQEPINTSNLPRMNVQQEVQKGLEQADKSVTTAGVNANKQILAAANVQPMQTPQQTAAAQISKGYLDIKI